MPSTDQLVVLLYPAAGALIGAVVGLLVRGPLLTRVARMAARTSSRVDDVLLAGVRQPIVVWTTLLGLHWGLSSAGFDGRTADWIQRATVILVILSVAWTVGGIAGALVREPHGAAGAIPSARILSSALHGAIVSVGFLVALQTVGISVAPILTAMGVGGLAVGLALQDTLANLFAGFHILASRQVRPGDFVQLSTGEKGFVEDITWRNTTIRQLPNNIVIVPNAQLAKSITLNYSLPDAEQAVVVQVGVSYSDDLEQVERVTIEVASEIQRDVTGAVASFTPFIRYHTFGESSINFSVIMRGSAVTDNFLMKHEFVKRLTARYRREGITIPFPQRTVHLSRSE